MRRWCDENWDTRVKSTERRDSAPSDTGAIPDVDVASLSGLQSGIIPLRLFPLRKWYYANPLWYYHGPSLSHQLRTDPPFYELVDPLLRELCRELLAAGLCTTPSCQGHFYPRQRFEKVWDELLREAGLIQSEGLVVRDSETNQAFRFQDPDYRLTWADFAAFYEQAARHQNLGYIGIAIPADRSTLAARFETDAFRWGAARLEPDAELGDILGQPIIGVHVEPASPEERDAAWAAVTAYIGQVLRTSRLDR